MIALYTDGTLTTMNEIISAFDLSSSLIMTGRVVMPKGEMESPVNPVIADIIEIRSLSVSPNFLKTSRYKMLVELPVSIMILFTPAFAIRVEIMRKLCVLWSYLLELVAIRAVFAGVSVGEPTVGTPLTTGSGRGEKGAELRERLRLCALASLKLVMFAVGFSLDRPKIPAQRPRRGWVPDVAPPMIKLAIRMLGWLNCIASAIPTPGWSNCARFRVGLVYL
ncbi:hypothetical protein GW17_00036786 [Ensete ventricosum]|nr:hypothetical protein GW17_00036786 [Ensete ventricosum]